MKKSRNKAEKTFSINNIMTLFKKTSSDGAAAFASDTTLFIIVSFFPFLMFLLTLLQYLPFSQAELMKLVSDFVPDQVAEMIGYLVDELYSSNSVVLSLTIITTLWSASRGILGIYRGLNKIYGIKETRNYVLLRLWMMLFTLVFVLMLFMLLGLYVFGELIKTWLSREFPILMGNRFTVLVVSSRSVIGIIALMIVFLVMYELIPNRRSKIYYELPGALIASLGWVLFSYSYSFYINNLSNMKATYGSLTAVVLCILWLYFCLNIFFFGAEINSWLYLCRLSKVANKAKKKAEKNAKKEAAVNAAEITAPAALNTSEPLPGPAMQTAAVQTDGAIPEDPSL